MVISLDAVLIRYVDYAHNFAIKVVNTHPSWTDDNGWTDDKLQSADPTPITIPPYQRKLVWTSDDIENLFLASGRLLGNITFANDKIANTNRSQLSLVDGLQRFSAITAIMRSLYNNVLQTNPTYPGLETHFQKISDTISKSMPTIWQHNHDMLLQSTRVGIKSSYGRLSQEVDDFIVEKLKKPQQLPEFALQVHNALFNKLLAIDTYHNFDNPDEIIETFKDVNSTGVSLTNTDMLRASIVGQAENLQWSVDDTSDGENRFTETLQPERNSNFNKIFREIFGLRLYQAYRNSKTNIFPDWANLTIKSLETLFDYIDNCEVAQKTMIDNTEYKFPYLKEIFNCGALPFIAFIWFYYQNYYLEHIKETKRISEEITDQYKIESRSENSDLEISNEKIESHVTETLEKLKNAEDMIKTINVKLDDAEIGDSRKIKLESEKKELEDLQQTYPNYYNDLPDFLGGSLDTTQNGLLFLRASYRRQMNGDVGTTAPIVDRLMNREITTMEQLSNEFNPSTDVGLLQDPPNEDWLRGRLLAKGGTTMARPFFNACLLPDRNTGETEFNLLVYGNRAGQWNLDHLIPGSRLVAGEGYIEGRKIVNLAPLDKAHNIMAQNIGCEEKIKDTGYYNNIKEYHPYCAWLVDEHHINHENDALIGGRHPLDMQESLVHNHLSRIGDERIEKLMELLAPKI
jgi:hypothetical protein